MAKYSMGKHYRRHKRPPQPIWNIIRSRIWKRDNRRCVRCGKKLALNKKSSLDVCHIDHILPLSRGGSNRDKNLRTLCRRCHVLRRGLEHKGMIASALKAGIIPMNWRPLVWDG